MAKKIKIAHVISSLKIGGAEAVLVDLIRALPQHEHHVIYFHGGPHEQSLRDLGIFLYHIKGIVCLYDPFFWLRLVRIVRKLQPDILHGSLWAANFAVRMIGLMLKVPTMCALHAHADINGAIRRILDRWSPSADCFVVVSDAVKRSCLQNEEWIPAQKIVTIRDGIDVKRVQTLCAVQQQYRSNFGLSSEHFVIGAVGRFSPEKNFITLIDAFVLVHAQATNARLLLVGYGQEEKLLRERVALYGLSNYVRFVIGQPAYGYYGLMDCFVVPSKSESLSLALLEAMLCGVPTILSAMAYEHDLLVHKKNGYVVPDNKPQTFAEAIMYLMQDDTRYMLAHQAQTTVMQEWNSALMVQGYNDLYIKLFQLSNQR